MADRLEFIIGAKDQFSGAFGKLTSMLPSVRTMALGATAAVAGFGAAIFAMAKTTANAYDKVQKFSDRIGIATEALSGFHYAAELSGISTQTMDMALQRMTRRVAEAAAGTGEAVTALKYLGIEAQVIAAMKPEDQFLEIADALSNLSSQSDAVRTAFKLFDSEGVSLLQTMDGGKAGIKAMTDEAEKFGLIVSAKAGASAAEFNNSLTRLGGALTGLKNKMAEELLPTFTEGFNNIADVIAKNRDKIIDSFKYIASGMVSFVDIMLRGAALSVVGLSMIFSGIDKVLGLYQKINEFGSDVAGLFNEDLAWAFNNTAQQTRNIRDAFVSTADNIDNFAAKIESLRATLSAFFSMTITAEVQVPGLPTEDQQTEAIDRAVEQHEKYLQYINALNSEYGELNLQNQITLAEREQEIQRLKVEGIQGIMQNFYAVGAALGKEFFELSKAAGIVDTIISTYIAAQKAYQAMVGIPVVGPALATAAAAAAIVAGMARAAQIKAQKYPSAHGGLERVPKEQTYLLDAGERVLSPNQNQDLVKFMEAGGGGISVDAINISLPNVKDVSTMSKRDWRDAVEFGIIPAINEAVKKRGVLLEST